MRSASLFGGLVVTALLGLAGAARAEPYDTFVQAETDVRSGHGDGAMFYPTNHLHVGDRVRVVKEEDGGWMAIVPPSDSFSWIRKDLLFIDTRQQPPVMVVNAETADIRIGSALTKDAPQVIGKRALRGTIVTPLANYEKYAMSDKEGVWIPINAPEGELRYIRAEALQKPAPAAIPTATVVTVPPAVAPAAVQDAEALYKRAINAEKFNPQEAIALYNQGANFDANADRRIQALNRANWLRDNLRNPTPTLVPGPTPGADLRMASAPAESKVVPLMSDPAAVPAPRLSAPQAVGVPTAATTTSSAPWPPTAAPGTPNEYSTHPGWLQTSGRAVEGRKTYVMVSDRGVPFYYVTAQPSVNLDAYVKHRVECYGDAIYNGELRANYMRVGRVEMREGQ